MLKNLRYLKALAESRGSLGSLKSVFLRVQSSSNFLLPAYPYLADFARWLLYQRVATLEDHPEVIYQAVLLAPRSSTVYREASDKLRSCIVDQICLPLPDDGATANGALQDLFYLLPCNYSDDDLWSHPSNLLTMNLPAQSGGPVCFSPDGSRIVSRGPEGSLIVWNARVGTKLGDLRGHTLAVVDCLYSPDGKFILSFSRESGPARIWDAETLELRCLLKV